MSTDEDPPFNLRLSMRSYFSTHHLWAALRFARTVAELEAVDGPGPRFDIAHRSFAVASVISSAAFVEAAVSELLQDAVDGHGIRDDGYLASLESEAVLAMAREWAKQGGDPGSVQAEDPIEKAQRLLECCGESRLEAGRTPIQDAQLVVRLRNYLIHFKPESIAADEAHLWELRLRGKFPDNKLMRDSGNPWWPDHAIGRGCAEWASTSARGLVDSVLQSVGIVPNYARIEATNWMGSPP